MIEDKSNRTKASANDFKFKMFAEDVKTETYRSTELNRLVNEADIIFNALTSVPDPTAYSNLQNETECLEKLEKLGREDLINKYKTYKADFELNRKRKEDKVFVDAIGKIIDVSKINKEIIPYLVEVEKRLQSLENHQKVGF